MRVLVAAASKYGGTAGIADAIGRALARAGLEVEVRPMEEVTDVARYGALILGSGVYVGQWLKDARRFVDANSDEIAALPTWLFSSGPLGDPPKPDEETAVNVDEIVTKTGAREHRLFAGVLHKSGLHFGDRAVVTAVRAAEGDFRDWDEIDAWAGSIASALKGTTREVDG